MQKLSSDEPWKNKSVMCARTCLGLRFLDAQKSIVPTQASNVATYIAHGDVALSVLMTTASTLGAIFMTPLLTALLAGQLVPVDAKARRPTHAVCLCSKTPWHQTPI